MDHLDTELDYIMVMLPSMHIPTGIIMQRENKILQQIYLAHKVKNLKTYVEKDSELILKGS